MPRTRDFYSRKPAFIEDFDPKTVADHRQVTRREIQVRERTKPLLTRQIQEERRKTNSVSDTLTDTTGSVITITAQGPADVPISGLITDNPVEENFGIRIEVPPSNPWKIDFDREVDVNDPDVDVDILAIPFKDGKIGNQLSIPISISNAAGNKRRIVVAFDENSQVIGSIKVYKTNLNRVIVFYETMKLVLETLDRDSKLDISNQDAPLRKWVMQTTLSDPEVVIVNKSGDLLAPKTTSYDSNKKEITLTFQDPQVGTAFFITPNPVFNTITKIIVFLQSFMSIMSTVLPVLNIINRIRAAAATLIPLNPLAGTEIAAASTGIATAKDTLVKIEQAVIVLTAIRTVIENNNRYLLNKRDSILQKVKSKLERVKAERDKLVSSL